MPSHPSWSWWGEEKTRESLVFPPEAAFPGLCRGKKVTQFGRSLTVSAIAPCLSFPSGSTRSPYPPHAPQLCSPAPSPLPNSLWARSSKGFHPMAHPHHPITTLFQETQALQGRAQPNLPSSTAAAPAGGQLAPVPPGHQPGWALPTLQSHRQQTPPGHARLHHYQCR